MRRVASLGTVVVALLFGTLLFSRDGLRTAVVSRLIDDPAASSSLGDPPVPPRSTPPFRVAIGAMISPERTFGFYGDLFRGVARRLHQPLEMKQRRTYEEVNGLVIRGEVDLAWVCTGGWTELARRRAARIAAVPVVSGRTTYGALIIAGPALPQARDLRGLSGSRFAFTDPISLSGCLYPRRRIEEMGQAVATYFASTSFTYGHDRSIEAVRRGLVDGASVDSLVYDYLAKRFPEEVEGIRILERSPSFPIPPLVVPSSTPEPRRLEIQQALLGLADGERGRQILDALLIEGFSAPDERAYESLR